MLQTSLVQVHRELGIPHPNASRGSDGFPLIYFPSSETKKEIHQIHLLSCAESHIRALKISFQDMAKEYAPHTIQHSL